MGDGSQKKDLPFLEHSSTEDGDRAPRTVIDHLPFVIGRAPPADLVIHSRRVSKKHAAIVFDGEGFRIRDLDSRNGTFVNGDRVTSCAIRNGDVLHIAQTELRFGYDPAGGYVPDSTLASDLESQNLFHDTRSLLRILTERAVKVVFQPIVHMDDRSSFGYEALGRNGLDDVELGPKKLFQIADERDKGEELSRLMRSVALDHAQRLPGESIHLFLNLHPSEMGKPELLDHLRAVRSLLPPRIQPVIEIHESAVTDTGAMARFKAELDTLGVRLAYDDFGAGQSRLMELADVPPHFIKLDMGLVRGIDASGSRRELVRALTKVMIDLGVSVLAEGIETEAERAACLDVGCALGQGYLFGHPAPV